MNFLTRASVQNDRTAKRLKRLKTRPSRTNSSSKGEVRILTRRQDLRPVPVFDAIIHDLSEVFCSPEELSAAQQQTLLQKPKVVGLILHASVCSTNSPWLCGLAWAEALQSQCALLPCLTLQVWSSFLLLDLAYYTDTEAFTVCKARLEPHVVQSGDKAQIDKFNEMFSNPNFCEAMKSLKDIHYQSLAKGILTPRPNIRSMINMLKSEAWKIAVIHFTSTPIGDFELNQLHLLNLASAVVNQSCLVKETRPYTSLYVEALSRLDLTPETCICIANHPFQVIDAALIGLQSLLITDTFNANMDFTCPHYRFPDSIRPAPADLFAALQCLHAQQPIPPTELAVGRSCLAMDSTHFMMSLAVILDISPADNGENRQVEVKWLSSNCTSLIPAYNVVLLKSDIELIGLDMTIRAPT